MQRCNAKPEKEKGIWFHGSEIRKERRYTAHLGHFKKMCHRCERTPENEVECKAASSCAATSASFMHCWRSRSNSKSSRSARFSAVLQISCRKWTMTCKSETICPERALAKKLLSFYIAFYCILLKAISAFCQGIYKKCAFWSVALERSRLDGSTGPAWDDDTVVKAQCQRNGRIIHQHHAFHGAAQTTQILKMEKKWKRDASDARPGKETPLHFWHRFSVVSVVFEHSALRKAPPRSTQCWPQVCEKTWQRIWQKARRQQHQHIATPKLTKMVQHETGKNSCTDLHSLCHWRYCMGKHGSLAFNFQHVFLDGKSIEDYKILNKDFHRKPTALAKGLFVWDSCDRA